MSETNPSTPKKKGGALKFAALALVLLAVGGGGTYAAFASGMIGHPGAPEDNEPKLVLKDQADPYPFAPAAGEGGEEKVKIVHGSGGSKYRTAYFNFSDDFTSNLANSAALVQVSLAAATHYDGRVLMWLNEHETALRSRILVELAATDEETVMTPQGKEQLQTRLTKAINDVLESNEGFGGVDDVYFRSFIVQ